MANEIKAQIAGFGDSYWVNTEVVGTGVAGADYPVQSKGISTAITNAIATATTPVATESVAGKVKVAANVATCSAEDVEGCVTSINAILTAMKNAGLMTADEE